MEIPNGMPGLGLDARPALLLVIARACNCLWTLVMYISLGKSYALCDKI